MALEQPDIGAGAVRATPSNFSEVMQQRAAAEASGGVASSGYQQQPRAGGFASPNGPTERGNQPAQDIDPSKVEKRLDGSQADPEMDPVDPEQGDSEAPADAEVAARREMLAKIEDAMAMGLPVDHEAIKDMLVVVNPDGQEETVTMHDLRRGYMRHRTYSKLNNQAQQLGSQAMSILRAEQQRNEEWKDPANILRDVELMGRLEQFEQAMYNYAKEKVEFAKLPPHEQYRIQAERDRKRLEAQFARERAQWQQQNQQNQQPNVEQRTQRIGNQLAQFMPKVFKELSFPTHGRAKSKFFEHLEIFHRDAGYGDLTAEVVRDAAISAKQELDEEYGRTAAASRRPANTNGLPARRMPGAPGSGVGGQTQTGKRARPSEFGGRYGTGGF